jgi:hypothetical protein
MEDIAETARQITSSLVMLAFQFNRAGLEERREIADRVELWRQRALYHLDIVEPFALERWVELCHLPVRSVPYSDLMPHPTCVYLKQLIGVFANPLSADDDEYGAKVFAALCLELSPQLAPAALVFA